MVWYDCCWYTGGVGGHIISDNNIYVVIPVYSDLCLEMVNVELRMLPDILLIGPLGINFSEILIKIDTFSLKKMHLKMSSGKWRPFFSASMC